MYTKEYSALKESIDTNLYELLFNRIEDTDLDDDLDNTLCTLFEKSDSDFRYMVATLKQGGFYQQVFSSIKMTIEFGIGTEYYKRSLNQKDKIANELINRYYGTDIKYRNIFKMPIVRNNQPKRRKEKYTKKQKPTPTELLISPI